MNIVDNELINLYINLKDNELNLIMINNFSKIKKVKKKKLISDYNLLIFLLDCRLYFPIQSKNHHSFLHHGILKDILIQTMSEKIFHLFYSM